MCRFISLRDAVAAEVFKAYNADKGIWAVDQSRGLKVNGEDADNGFKIGESKMLAAARLSRDGE